MGIAEIAAGEQSAPHEHEEFEHFLVVRGSGRVRIEQDAHTVSTGDAIRVTPGQRHSFEASVDGPLEVVCLWSQEPFGARS